MKAKCFKKTILFIGAVFVVLIMVSSATAIPQLNSRKSEDVLNKIDDKTLKDLEKNTEFHGKIETLNLKKITDFDFKTKWLGDGLLYMLLSVLSYYFTEIFKELFDLFGNIIGSIAELTFGLVTLVVQSIIIGAWFLFSIIIYIITVLIVKLIVNPLKTILEFLRDINDNCADLI